MQIGATPLSLTPTCQHTIHYHLGTMIAFHMVEEHNRALDLDKITIRLMLSLGSSSRNSSSSIGTIKENIRVRKGLNLLKIRCCSL